MNKVFDVFFWVVLFLSKDQLSAQGCPGCTVDPIQGSNNTADRHYRRGKHRIVVSDTGGGYKGRPKGIEVSFNGTGIAGSSCCRNLVIGVSVTKDSGGVLYG